MKFQKLDTDFSVCKLSSLSPQILSQSLFFAAKTDEEFSLVCPSSKLPAEVIEEEPGWKALRICGILDFSLIGILSEISNILAENKIGIFAVSTFNTDYIFVKNENFEHAITELEKAGHEITA